jgi:hypothetical protein
MAPTLNLDFHISSITERSEKWLTTQQINKSPLDAILGYVYLNQLEELQNTLAFWGERTVEHSIAAEEMQALTEDFWIAVGRVKSEQEERRNEKRKEDGKRDWPEFKGGEAAKMWAKFRRMYLK